MLLQKILVLLLFIFICVSVSSNEIGNQDADELTAKWKKCCKEKSNVCFGNECFWIQENPVPFGETESSCSAKYSIDQRVGRRDVYPLSKINENDMKALIMEFRNRTERGYERLWTGFGKCTGLPEFAVAIPKWIEETLIQTPELNETCLYLVLYLERNSSEDPYALERSNKKLPTICQFSRPEFDGNTNENSSKIAVEGNTEYMCQHSGTEVDDMNKDRPETVIKEDPFSTAINSNKAMEIQWQKCCSHSRKFCLENVCYWLEDEPMSWETARSRCRSRYSQWPSAVNIMRIRNENYTDILKGLSVKFKPLLQGKWTSGVACPEYDPKYNPERRVIRYRWTSRDVFPEWLTKKISFDKEMCRGCKFLVVYPHLYFEKSEYKFEAEDKKHLAVCEFSLTNDKDNYNSTESPVTDYSETSVTFTGSSVITENTTLISSEDSIVHYTSTIPSATTTSSKDSSTTKTSSTAQHIRTIFTQISGENPFMQKTTATNAVTNPTTIVGCKGTKSAGIVWPDTAPGITVKRPCPDGMNGTAEWTCDREISHFKPDHPRMHDCRHQWLERFVEEIKKGRDALSVSRELVNKTKSNPLSHGDLSALVRITALLLKLFQKQGLDKKESIIISSGKRPPSYHFTESIASIYSHVLSDKAGRVWTDLDQDIQHKDASQILQQVTKVGNHLSCIKAYENDDLQFTVAEDNINLQTFIFNGKLITGSHVFPKRGKDTENIYDQCSLTLPDQFALDKYNSPCQTVKSAVGVIYKHIGSFLGKPVLNEDKAVVSPVISFSLSDDNNSIALPEGRYVSIDLEKNEEINRFQFQKRKIICVFWNFSRGDYGEWDDNGCFFLSKNSTHARCSCNHLTNFAVIMDLKGNVNIDDPWLEVLTYICCGTSLAALIATVICLLSIKSLRCRRSTITCNLSCCLLFANVLILFGLDQVQLKVLCAFVAATLQYFLLSAFCWMLLEGHILYQMVIVVFAPSFELPTFCLYAIGYGVPLIIVGISAGLRLQDYGDDMVCWLSRENGLMWSFVGPICVTILINLVIFILTIKSASSLKAKKEQSKIKNVTTWMKGSLSILCLLGITWCLGFFYMDEHLYPVTYVFIVLNGLQGVFIFFFHVLLNNKASTVLFDVFQNALKWKFPSKLRRSSNLTSSTAGCPRRTTKCSITGINNLNGHASNKLRDCEADITSANMRTVPNSTPQPKKTIYERKFSRI